MKIGTDLIRREANMTQTTSGYASISGGRLYYESTGEGRTLVLGHAGVCDRRQWDDQWAAFAREYHVIRYDLRGYGQSDPVSGPVSRRADLYELLQALDVTSAAPLGCSMSGTIVLDFTLDHPEMVWALIPFSATPSGFAFNGERPQSVNDMIAAMQQGDVERALELQNRIWFDGPFRQPHQVDAAARARVTAMNRRPVSEGTFYRGDSQPLNPLTPSAAQRLGEIAVPTLVLAGHLDDPEIVRAADVMAAGIRGAQKTIIEDGAHLANMEHPAAFNQAVLDFLRATG